MTEEKEINESFEECLKTNFISCYEHQKRMKEQREAIWKEAFDAWPTKIFKDLHHQRAIVWEQAALELRSHLKLAEEKPKFESTVHIKNLINYLINRFEQRAKEERKREANE